MVKLSTEAYSSFIAFIVTFIANFIASYWLNFHNYSSFIYLVIFSSLSTIICSVALQILFQRRTLSGKKSGQYQIFSISWRAGLLGSLFAVGFILSCDDQRQTLKPFGYYLCILAFFHWSEYFATAVSSWETLTLDSYLLNHSVEYWAAASLSWVEFFVEYYFCPWLKSFTFIIWMGILLCVVGEGFRKSAMFTAGRNFTHLIQYQKRTSHQLVTHGVYSLFRHPSYVGWFWWSIGTQVTMCNPICTIAYAMISWRFFNDRIYHEEITLINFFGEQYVEYQSRVPTGLPGITGFRG